MTGECVHCHYPINAPTYEGQIEHCPYCGTINEAISAEIPNSVIIGLACFAGGVLLGPAVYQALQGTSAFLARQARERIK